MAEKQVGTQLAADTGMIVYDESVTSKRRVVFM